MLKLPDLNDPMDKETIVSMLTSVKETASIGPKVGPFNLGERIDFAINKGLLKRSAIGNFAITPKGEDLLAGKIDWEKL